MKPTPLMTATAQLAMLGFNRPSLDEEFRSRLTRHRPGGVLLYGDALGPADEIRELTAEIRSCVRDLPPFIAVDQEGGRVQGWGPPHCEPLPSAAEVGWEYRQSGELMEVTLRAMEIGRSLAAVGINLDFAPVLDVHTNPDNPIIGERSFGAEPELVVEVGCAFIEGLHAAGVVACGKHFPGHGDTDLDSHLALPAVSHGRERLETVELLPFAAAISRGLEVMMTAHVLYPAWDRERPATISPAIIDGVLRDELGFSGLVFTDDLKMRGLRDEHDLLEAGLLALEAGCDVLLSCTEHDRQEMLLEGLAKAQRDGRLTEARLRQSLERIATVKQGWLAG
ncbi:MAG: beta-N-acetylhexosaminidase [bacterium]|nr:beta-N-acetylhexosaminidase [bacterium]